MYSFCSFLLLYINQKASPNCICFELYLTRYQFNNFNLGFDNSTPKSFRFIFFLPAMLVFSLFIHIQSYRKCVCVCWPNSNAKKRVYNGKPTPTDTDTDFAHRTTTIVCKHIVNVLFSFIFFFCVCFFFRLFNFCILVNAIHAFIHMYCTRMLLSYSLHPIELLIVLVFCYFKHFVVYMRSQAKTTKPNNNLKM